MGHRPYSLLATNDGIIPSLSATGECGYLGIMLGAGGGKGAEFPAKRTVAGTQ